MARAGAVDADDDLLPEPGRDLPDRRSQHLLMVGKRVRPGVAGPQQHGQALARIRSPGPQRVKAVAHFPGGRRAFLVRAGSDQRRVHVDHQPARQRLPGDDQPREPRGSAFCQLPYVRPGLRAGTGDPVQHGRGAGQVHGPPYRRAARRGPQHGSEMRQHRDIAHARRAQRDRDRHRHQRGTTVEKGRFPRPPQRHAQPGGQSRLVSGLAQQDRAGVPDQARPVARDLQGMVPAVMLHGEERSSPGDCNVWLPRNLPGPGRSSRLNPQACMRTTPLGPAPARCTTETPATRHEAAKPQLTTVQKSAVPQFTTHAECRRLEGNQLRRQLPTSANHATRLGGGAFCACKAGPSRLFMNCS